MPHLIAISQALNAVKASLDILKVISTTRDSAKVLENTIQLNLQTLAVQGALMDAYEEQSKLVASINDLNYQIAKSKTWNAEKEKYQLIRLDPGIFTYALKQEIAKDEPFHYICKTCYEQSKKSVLDCTEPCNGIYHLLCQECKSDLLVGTFDRSVLNCNVTVDYDPFRNM